MRIAPAALQTLALAAALAAPARGQVPYDLCLDRNLRRIPGRIDSTLTFTAEARLQGGTPVILWNAAATRRISADAKLFLYLHECAHHALGHLALPESPVMEQEADCWSIQAMLDAGLLAERRLPFLLQELGTTRGDALHLAGPARVRSIQQCLRLRDSRSAWGRALDAMVAATADGLREIRGPALEGEFETDEAESALDLPGIFGCVVQGERAVWCVVVPPGLGSPPDPRFRALVSMLHGWLPTTWTATERNGDSTTAAHQFLAQDSERGTVIMLLETRQRGLLILVRAGGSP
jgi:hypothetical protein